MNGEPITIVSSDQWVRVTWIRSLRRPRPADRSATQRSACFGFTLVELLVSLGIIALLAALTASAVSASKSKAGSVHCQSNLRQIGIAIRVYADGNEGRLPTVGGEEADVRPPSLATLLEVSPRLLACPDQPPAKDADLSNSYEWNLLLNGRRLYWSGSGGVRRPDALEPMLSDRQPWHGHKNAVFVDGHVGRIR